MSPERQSRLECALAWLAAIAIPVLLILAVAVPWWQRQHQLHEQVENTRNQISRYQELIASLPALREALAQEQSNDDFKAFYFDAATASLAGARLQSDVQEMIRAAGARPISTQVLPPDPQERPQRVLIRTQLQGDTQQLLDVLYRIEESRPFLFVDQMSIRSMTPRGRPIPRGASRRVIQRMQPDVGQLTVRLDIFGYSLGTEE
jgi:general secretion pathway protein M